MDQSLPVLSKALDILESFLLKPKGLIGQESFTAREFQERLRIPRATLYRRLRTLGQRGYIRRDSRGGPCKLGFKLLQLAIIAERQMEIVTVAQDFLIHVLNETHETSSLAVLDGSEVVFVKSFDSLHSVQVVLKAGFRAPVHCTAAGKAILAYAPEEKVREITRRGLESYTPSTITRTGDLRTQLQIVRREGYSLNLGELRGDRETLPRPYSMTATKPPHPSGSSPRWNVSPASGFPA
ncbi:MAG: IclR family transcriptional regulator [Nitrospinota bacterium]